MLWKLLAGAVVIALAGFFLLTFGNAKYNAGELAERVKWKDVTLQHQKEIEGLELANAENKSTAIENYAERLATFQPIVLHSKETVERYAETDAGRSLCLSTDRVLGIEQDRTTEFSNYPFAPEDSDRTVRANSDFSK